MTILEEQAEIGRAYTLVIEYWCNGWIDRVTAIDLLMDADNDYVLNWYRKQKQGRMRTSDFISIYNTMCV